MSLKHKYRNVLIGFEKYSFSDKAIDVFEPDFEMALHDYNACQNCDGKACRTWLNHQCSDWYRHLKTREGKCNETCYIQTFRGYYALWHKGIRDGRPAFTVLACPGVVERREQIVAALTSFRRFAS